MDDLISKQEVLEDLSEPFVMSQCLTVEECEAMNRARNLCLARVECIEPAQRWIPIKSRPMTEEERREWSERLGYDLEYDEAVIYTSQLPGNGEDVLVCTKYGRVYIDTFYDDEGGCYFDDNGDMDGIVAWMPLPEPYKEDEQ